MKNKIFTLFAFTTLLLSFTHCATSVIPAQQILTTSNKDVKVELLFEIDGCKVYRFYDGGPKYFTKCAGSSSTSWIESCGKGCWREVENMTAYTK